MSTTPIQLPALEPPKYYSPFDARAKLMNLQNLALQQQEGQQQLQLGKLNIDEHNRALARQQATDAAFKNAYTVDENGRPQLDEGRLTKDLSLAGFGSAATPILEAHTKYQKSLADLADTRSKVALLEQDAAGHLAAGVQAGNNDAHLFVTHVKQAVDSGAITPAHAKALTDPVIAALDQDPTGETARALVGQITTQMMAGSPKQQELANSRRTSESTVLRNTAQGNLADAGTKQKLLELAGQTAPDENSNQQAWDQWRAGLPEIVKPLIPPMFSPTAVKLVRSQGLTLDQRRQADQAAATLAETKARDAANMGNSETELAVIATNPKETPERRAAAGAALKRLDQSKQASRPVVNNLIPGVPTAPSTGATAQLHGEDYLKTLPASFAARIRQIATGDLPAPTGRAATTGAGGQIMDALMQYDPQYSTLLGKGRTDELKQFTDTHPGSAGGQLIALNTMLHHADLYMDAATALKNGTFKPGNEIYNKIATIFGAAPPTNAALLAQFFASETGKVATGGVPAEGEIKSILSKMSTDGSPEAMEGAAKTLIGIAAGRMIPLKDRRDKWKLDKLVDILGPDAKAVLQRRGFDPETMKPVQQGGGGGKPPLIKTKAEYDNLPSGAIYTESNGKTYRKP